MDKNEVVETPKQKAQKAVHTAAIGAATVAATPIPFADAIALMPIQTAMIVQIYRTYGKNVSKGMVQGVLKSTFATTMGRSLAGSLFKLVPGAGSILGGAISAGVAVSVTEAIGQVLIKEFEDGNAIDLESLSSIILTAIAIATKKK
ncbi:YcjF family protein [Ligilactobacillus animalis]|uniref:YcjF family protein n=1 Tax=Ligilactobacillus animalis TaxID=1605 RepID=UPI00082478D0|nr:DUF697 domain-containing protein [Ligilactobacillus animalis]OCX49472.1 GTPase [Ligilactobacillus animalis]QHQ70602.1 DUF697 domain-containing protein [Ligilactobacillus animalis]